VQEAQQKKILREKRINEERENEKEIRAKKRKRTKLLVKKGKKNSNWRIKSFGKDSCVPIGRKNSRFTGLKIS
jgi:hypothetical protein